MLLAALSVSPAALNPSSTGIAITAAMHAIARLPVFNVIAPLRIYIALPN